MTGLFSKASSVRFSGRRAGGVRDDAEDRVPLALDGERGQADMFVFEGRPEFGRVARKPAERERFFAQHREVLARLGSGCGASDVGSIIQRGGAELIVVFFERRAGHQGGRNVA